jgi:murein DD-endopeptidase MepM/ murein hydrolase activator NlpD
VPKFYNPEPPDSPGPSPFDTDRQSEVKKRKSAKRILLSLSLLIILGFIAYFIIYTPKKKGELTSVEKVTESYCLKKGELLPTAFIRCGITESMAQKVIAALRNCKFNFRGCRAGDTIKTVMEYSKTDSAIDSQGVIRKIEYQMNYDRIYEINIDSTDKVTVSMLYKEFEIRTELVRGTINSSFYESVIAIGETPTLAFNYADIFDWEIDFFVETQEGDSFFILIDKKYDNDKMVAYGRIHLVRYKGKIGDFYGIFFEDPKGQRDYYDLEGKSLRKAFLRSPLRYSRISSYFNKARYHPILRIVRPHTGIDYVAPRGTPVSVIGDGTVTFAGWKGGYGRLVEIVHGNGYKSRYGHLSGFASGIRIGRRVAQGQKVGYVGTTGLSTGPHLHFELLRQGSWVNPLRIIPPRAEPVRQEYLQTFYEMRDELLKQISDINL